MSEQRILKCHCSAAPNNEGAIRIETPEGETLFFDEKNKAIFKGETGESVIEYSGLATDGNSKISWAIAKFEPNGYSSYHYHKERTEVYYVTQGEATITLDGKEHKLTVGDRLTITSGQKHQVHNKSTGPLAIIVSCVPAWSYLDSHNVTPEVAPKPTEKLVHVSVSDDAEEPSTTISSLKM